MKLIHGRVTDALWRTDLPEVDVPLSDAAPTWGLHIMDRSLGPLERGQLILVTGGRYAGTSSLARSIALANAQRGLHVNFYASDHDEEKETRHLVSASIGKNLVDSEDFDGDAEHDVFLPINDLPGCIRVYAGRPSLLPHEGMSHVPDVMICDEIDRYLHIDDESFTRMVVLEALKDFAQRNSCVVIAVSKNYGPLPEAEYWHTHVDTHLEVRDENNFDLEVILRGEVGVDVIRCRRRWTPGMYFALADQRVIGRLGDLTDDRLDTELTNLLGDDTTPQQYATPTIDDVDFDFAVSRKLKQEINANREQFLRRFGMTAVFAVQNERIDLLQVHVDEVNPELSPVFEAVLDIGDGVQWKATLEVEATVTVAGKEASVITLLLGQVTLGLTDEGRVRDLSLSRMLIPWTQQVRSN